MSTSIRCQLAGATVAAVMLAGPACVEITGFARFVEREEKRFPVTGKPVVSVSTFDGSIEIRPSDKPEVVVTIEKRAANKEEADRIDVHTEQNGGRIVVDVRMPKSAHMFGFHQSASASLVVSLPASSDVEAHSGDGSIDIARISGTLDLRSGDGSI